MSLKDKPTFITAQTKKNQAATSESNAPGYTQLMTQLWPEFSKESKKVMLLNPITF